MKAILIERVLGIFFFLCSILFLFLARTINIIFLSGTALSVVCGITSFFFSVKTKNKLLKATTIPQDISDEAAEKLGVLLSKQNEMVKSWEKTMTTRDKLKLLEISANARKSS